MCTKNPNPKPVYLTLGFQISNTNRVSTVKKLQNLHVGPKLVSPLAFNGII